MPNTGQTGGSEPPTQTRGLATRSHSQRPSEKQGETAGTNTGIHNEAQARAHLEKGGYLSKTMEATTTALATVLLQLTQCTGKIPKEASEGMRAVALVLGGMKDTQSNRPSPGGTSTDDQLLKMAGSNLTDSKDQEDN